MEKPKVRKPKKFTDQIKILLYGMTGVGKTYLAATVADQPDVFGKVLMLMIDPGDLTISDPNKFNHDNIDVADVRTIAQLEKWNDWLETENVKTKEYGTVIIEGASDLSELALYETLERAHKADSKRNRDSPDIAHYKEQQIIAGRGVRYFRDLPMHVIWTALEQEKKDEKNGKVFIRPLVPGQMVNSLGAYFDFIGHLSVAPYKEGVGSTRLLRMQPTDLIQAKDRTNHLDEVIEDPTMPLVLEMIKNADTAGLPPRVDHRVFIKRAQIATK